MDIEQDGTGELLVANVTGARVLVDITDMDVKAASAGSPSLAEVLLAVKSLKKKM